MDLYQEIDVVFKIRKMQKNASFFLYLHIILRNIKKSWKKFKKGVDFIFYIWYIKNANLKKREKKLGKDLWKLSRTSSNLRKPRKKQTLRKVLFFLRVWSWLRMNAGGMPKTCKSNEAAHWFKRKLECLHKDGILMTWNFRLVAQGWVTRG